MIDQPSRKPPRPALARTLRVVGTMAHAGLIAVSVGLAAYFIYRVRTESTNHWGGDAVWLSTASLIALAAAGVARCLILRRVSRLAVAGLLLALPGLVVSRTLADCRLLLNYDTWVKGMPEPSRECCKKLPWARFCNARNASVPTDP